MVAIIEGPASDWEPSMTLSEAKDTWWNQELHDSFPGNPQAADFDGDGLVDIVANTTDSTGVPLTYLLFGASDRSGSQSLESEVTVAGSAGAGSWTMPRADGDADGDGLADLLIYDSVEDEVQTLFGADLPMEAAEEDDVVSQAWASWGPSCLEWVGDVDGDGLDDWMVSYHDWSDGDQGSGLLVLVAAADPQPTDGDYPWEVSSNSLYGADDYESLGAYCAVGDVDADDSKDLALYYRNTDEYVKRFRVIAARALLAGPYAALPSGPTIYETDDTISFTSVSGIRDWDGDGFGDLLFAGNATEDDEVTSIVMVPGWAIPWDQPEYW